MIEAVIRSEQCQDTEKRLCISLGPGATKEAGGIMLAWRKDSLASAFVVLCFRRQAMALPCTS